MTIDYKNRDAWLDGRLLGVGASDAPVILGLNPWKSVMQLWAEKRRLVASTIEETEAMEWGHRLEPALASKYADETRRMLKDPGDFTIEQADDCPWMLATLDRVIVGVVDETTGEEAPFDPSMRGALELKTTSAFKRDEWAGEAPLMYQVQVQHQLAVTGMSWGSLAVLIGGQAFLWVDIRRHDGLIAKMRALEEEFWWRVETGTPPDPDASEGTRAALHALYPQEQGATIALPVEALDWDERLTLAKEQATTAKKEIDLFENQIKAAMGDALFGVLPNGVTYKWKVEPRAGHVVGPSQPRVLRRSAKR